MKSIIILAYAVFIGLTGHNFQHTQEGIQDPAFYGVQVLSGGNHFFSSHGEGFILTEKSECRVYGPFQIMQKLKGKTSVIAPGILAPGNYFVERTKDRFVAIAYSQPNFQGDVMYLKPQTTYNSVIPGGIASIRSLVKFKVRTKKDATIQNYWPMIFCAGEYSRLESDRALRDIDLEASDCDG